MISVYAVKRSRVRVTGWTDGEGLADSQHPYGKTPPRSRHCEESGSHGPPMFPHSEIQPEVKSSQHQLKQDTEEVDHDFWMVRVCCVARRLARFSVFADTR